jgi:phage shock protein A
MGIFGRMKRAVKSKANAAVDKMIDPARELEMAILELEKNHKQALADLLAYKTTAKQMEREMAGLQEKAAQWEKRAVAAVKKGDDDTARQCLRERKDCLARLVKAKADRDEAAGFAIELNRSRKKVETQLQILKLKKGTMATQIAAARSGTGNAFGFGNQAFERMDKAEEKIESDAIAAEVEASMEADDLAGSFDAHLAAAARAADAGPVGADDELARLKGVLAAEKERKLLKK